MGILFTILILSFIIIFVSNVSWVVLNIIAIVTNGIQSILHGSTVAENIYFSIHLKWLLFFDISWLVALSIFLLNHKYYKTDPTLHYLDYNPLKECKICVIIPTLNEELAIEQVVTDYIKQKNVKEVIVVDNHSTDRTVEIAKRCGATVITKESNEGINHSYYLGFNESLKTDANIIVLTEADGTYAGYDLEKMIPYLDNCDVVVGTRQAQILTEKGNQNSIMHVWGNYFVAKLLQIKYFSVRYLGIIQLTDVGCSYRCMRRSALEKIINKITFPNTDEIVVKSERGLFTLFLTILAIENDLKIVEVPVTFKKRIGFSKMESDKTIQGIKYGLHFIWFVLTR